MTLYIFIALAVALGINILMFLPAFKFKTDKLTDASYAVTFVVIGLFALFSESVTSSKAFIFGMVALWAIRLGGFLVYRVSLKGKDNRFDGMRENFVQFAKFWITQGFAVWVVMLGVLLALKGQDIVAGPLFIIGIIVWALGFIIESVADWQKFKFSQNPANKGLWIEDGVWNYSRHPNYLGEILVWSGVYIAVVSSLTLTQSLIALISPLFITILLCFVSGIPILEKKADQKWGNKKAYNEYKKRTNILLILPHKINKLY